jgi:hypothetical protein
MAIKEGSLGEQIEKLKEEVEQGETGKKRMSEIPPEVIDQIDNLSTVENAHLQRKNAKTLKKYMKTNSDLRIVSDYLFECFKNNPLGTFSYGKIARDLKMNLGTVRCIIGELATWKDWILTIVNTPKKTGYFQLYSKDFTDTQMWIIRNQRIVATKEQRLEKTRNAVAIRSKRNTSKKKIINEQKAKN